MAPSTNPQDHLKPSATIENTTKSLEGHNESLQQAIIEKSEEGSSAYDRSGPPFIPAVDPGTIASEIVRSSDKSIKVVEKMASSSINPDASQVSFQLQEVMVWDDRENHGLTCNVVKDQQHISSSDDQESALSSSRKRRLVDNPDQEKSNKSANTTSEPMQSIDDGRQIASSTSPRSQESLSGSDLVR